jgi:phytoene synthase
MINKTFYSIFQKGSKTYFYSSLFFPTNVKKDVFELYAFVRKADNYVDSVSQDAQGFYKFKERYNQAINGEKSNDIVINSFAELVEKKEFEHEWVDAFLDSMEMDITKDKYYTMKETLDYIYGSAEVIGLMMAKVMNLKDESFEYAKLLGRSMQYINFIRDIAEDLELGRTYFPKSEIENHGLISLKYSDTINQPEEFKNFIRKQIQRYCFWQNIAEQGYNYIPKRYLISVKTASEMYHWTAEQIYKDPFVIYKWKVKPLIIKILTTTLANLIDTKKPKYKPLPCYRTKPVPIYSDY